MKRSWYEYAPERRNQLQTWRRNVRSVFSELRTKLKVIQLTTGPWRGARIYSSRLAPLSTPRAPVLNWTAPASGSCCRHESFIHRNSGQDHGEDDRCEEQKPAPVLDWMAQNTDKMAAIVIGDDGDECVT